MLTPDQEKMREAAKALQAAPDWHQNHAYFDAAVTFETLANPAAILALLDQVEAQGWQPIETAPKDGSEVLLMVELRAGVRGRQLVGHYMAGGHCIEDHPPIERGWYFWDGRTFDLAAKPLKWRPLPPPPEAA